MTSIVCNSSLWDECLCGMYNLKCYVKVALFEQSIFLKQMNLIILFPKKFACVHAHKYICFYINKNYEEF